MSLFPNEESRVITMRQAAALLLAASVGFLNPQQHHPQLDTHIYIIPEHLNTSYPHQPLPAIMSDAKALSLDEMVAQSKLFCIISRVSANCLPCHF